MKVMEMIDGPAPAQGEEDNGDPSQKIPSQLIMMFISALGLWILGHSDYIYIDGTFDSAPDLFGQIYFILGQQMVSIDIFILISSDEQLYFLAHRTYWQTCHSLVHINGQILTKYTSLILQT